MEKTFTPIDLIRFLYNETTTGENEQIHRLLQKDDKVQDTCRAYRQLINSLDRNKEKPSREVLENVLDHARNKN